MAAGAVSLRISHDMIILSFCNIVKGQANYQIHNFNVICGSSKLKEAKRIIAYILVLYTWLSLVMRKHKKVQIHDA